jgi:hypothetical protein
MQQIEDVIGQPLRLAGSGLSVPDLLRLLSLECAARRRLGTESGGIVHPALLEALRVSPR